MWALLERHLLDTMGGLAREFVRRYTRPDGTLVWRDSWLGMDGSDDAYESFGNFPLLAALNGDLELDALARAEWEAITRQFTEYGQVYREFDSYYDWMHHGESSLLFYYFTLCRPDDLRMRARAVRFASMYTGEDAEADNYDPVLRMIRSPITGSRGPRYENSAEDWVTHRPVLADYPPPFDDIPGVEPGARANWNDDLVFAEILRTMNQRMMRGDVPLNLTATSLIANAFLYSGEAKYADWVREYVTAWMQRAEANGGVLPDNIGPTGRIGECFDGRWWGGYYGWQWPHGFTNLIEPALIGAANAQLLTGQSGFLEFPRRLLDAIWERRQTIDGVTCIPHRHGAKGWYDYRPTQAGDRANTAAPSTYPILLWFLSQDPKDAARIAEWEGGIATTRVRDGRGKGDNIHTSEWYHFIRGHNPAYPEAILRANHAEVTRRCARMLADNTDPETWDVHHWQELNPVVCEGLVQLMLGGPAPVYHGGLLHSRLRYFDAEARKPGVPPDVAALVREVDSHGVLVELINLNPLQERRVIVQAGAYAEHQFTSVSLRQASSPAINVDAAHFEIALAPASGGEVRLEMRMYANVPKAAHPRL